MDKQSPWCYPRRPKSIIRALITGGEYKDDQKESKSTAIFYIDLKAANSYFPGEEESLFLC